LMTLPLPLKFSTYSGWPIYRYLQKLLRPYPSLSQGELLNSGV
jgi:hypothetical protein